jgi:hypothetical protein
MRFLVNNLNAKVSFNRKKYLTHLSTMKKNYEKLISGISKDKFLK